MVKAGGPQASEKTRFGHEAKGVIYLFIYLNNVGGGVGVSGVR